MDQVYWLIELRTGIGPAMYYTTPHHWGSNVDLATKFHTKVAAEAEADHLRIPHLTHQIVAADHMWCG